MPVKTVDRETSILERYRDRKLTRARAAHLLKCSQRHINRRMAELGLERVEGARPQKDELAAKKREVRMAAARMVVEGRISVKQAELRAGCSNRTMYRYIQKAQSEARKKRK